MGAQGLLDQASDAIIAPLMTQLEKVTGDPGELRNKAAMWRQSAQTVLDVAARTRDDVSDLGARWHGAAADAFAAEMSEHDATFLAMARDMQTTATCLSQAADQCEQAENMIRELIKELVEAIAVASTMTAITSVLTAGASVVAGALADAAEAAQFVGRAGELVDKLAEFLRRAKDLLEDLRTAQRAVRASQRKNRKLRTLRESARRRGSGTHRSAGRPRPEHRAEPHDRRQREPGHTSGHAPARHAHHGPTHGQRIAVSGAEHITRHALGLDQDGFGQVAETAGGDLEAGSRIDPNEAFDSAPTAGQSPAIHPRITLETNLTNEPEPDRRTIDLPTHTAD